MKSHLHQKNTKGNRKHENVKIRAFCETAKQHPNCTYTYILVLAISQIFQKTKNKKHKNLFFLYYHFFKRQGGKVPFSIRFLFRETPG